MTVRVFDHSTRYRSFIATIQKHVADARAGGRMLVMLRIGPAEAEAALSFSLGNRHESASFIDSYERDMSNDKWTFSSIAFDVIGSLRDGHHRLRAVIQSGTEHEFGVWFGLTESEVANLDRGKVRSISDQMTLAGRPISRVLVASVSMCIALGDGGRSIPKRTRAEVERGCSDNSTALGALAEIVSSQYPASYWGACLFAYPVFPNHVIAMIEAMRTPEGLSGPAFTLREYLRTRESAGTKNQLQFARKTLYAIRAIAENRSLLKFAEKGQDDERKDPRTGKPLPVQHPIVEWFIGARKRAAVAS